MGDPSLTHRGNKELTVITSKERKTIKNKTGSLAVAENDVPHWLTLWQTWLGSCARHCSDDGVVVELAELLDLRGGKE